MESSIIPTLIQLRASANSFLSQYEPLAIVVVPIVSFLIARVLQSFIQLVQEKGVKPTVIGFVMTLVKLVPGVKKYMDAEKQKVVDKLQSSGKSSRIGWKTELPNTGLGTRVLEEMKDIKQKDPAWQGKCSGTVYIGGNESEGHFSLINEACSMFAHTNPLHLDVFKSVVRFEAEVVAMTGALFGSKEKASGGKICGNMTSGGTESILLAVKSSRDYMRAKKNITCPEMIIPESAHSAYDKACQYFKIKLWRVPVNKEFQADVKAIKKYINKNTIMIVGSAPGFPHGIVDPIEELGELAVSYGICLHVDLCLGGFVLPFARKLGLNQHQKTSEINMASEPNPKTCGKGKEIDHDDQKSFGRKDDFYRSPFIDASRSFMLQKEQEHHRNGGYSYKDSRSRTYGIFDFQDVYHRETRSGGDVSPMFPSLFNGRVSQERTTVADQKDQRATEDLMHKRVENSRLGSSSSLPEKKRAAQEEFNRQVKKKKYVSDYPKGMCCSYCQEPFHYRRDCPKRIGKTEFMIKGTDLQGWDDMWFVSLTRKEHCCGKKDLFMVLCNSFGIEGCPQGFPKEYFRGKGSVLIYSSGQMHKIKNVYYVPTLKKNVLSIERLTQNGYEIEFDGDICHITQPNNPRAEVRLKEERCWICKEEDHPTFMCPLKQKNIQEPKGAEKAHEDKGKKPEVNMEEKYNGLTYEDIEKASMYRNFETFAMHKDDQNGFMEQAEVMYPTEISSINDCLLFMDLIHIATKIEEHKEKFQVEFERLVKWFVKEFLESRVRVEMPPLDIFGYPVDLLDLYMLVQKMGGYNKVCGESNWPKIATLMGYGKEGPMLTQNDPIVKDLRMIYVLYLEMLEWYHLKYKGRELVIEVGETSNAVDNKKKNGLEDNDLPPKKRSRN